MPYRSHRQTELTLLSELGDDRESESVNVVEPPELVLTLEGLELYLYSWSEMRVPAKRSDRSSVGEAE